MSIRFQTQSPMPNVYHEKPAPGELGEALTRSLKNLDTSSLRKLNQVLDQFQRLPGLSERWMLAGLQLQSPETLFKSLLPRPSEAYRKNSGKETDGTYPQIHLKGKVTPHEIARFFARPEWRTNGTASRIAADPQLIERLLAVDPEFKTYLENKLGGEIKFDNRGDGLVTLRKLPEGDGSRKLEKPHEKVQRFLDRMGKGSKKPMQANNLRGAQGVKGSKPSSGAGGAGREPGPNRPEAPTGLPAQASGSSVSMEEGTLNSNDIAHILQDPSLSIEDKIAMILAQFAEKLMKKLEGKVNQMSQSGGKSETKLQSEIQLITQKLSRAMETLSNVMKSFHEAMTTSIKNIR